MSGCTVTSTAPSKACSGKCRGSACAGGPRVWVVAACEGMISLFEKNTQGALAAVSQRDQVVFASLEAFQQSLMQAEETRAFDQLVIIGSGNDIAWIHASLPHAAMRHIVAEIEYPLLPAWFQQPLLHNLTHALERVFSG